MLLTIMGCVGVAAAAAAVTRLCFQAITRLSANSAGAVSEMTAR